MLMSVFGLNSLPAGKGPVPASVVLCQHSQNPSERNRRHVRQNFGCETLIGVDAGLQAVKANCTASRVSAFNDHPALQPADRGRADQKM